MPYVSSGSRRAARQARWLVGIGGALVLVVTLALASRGGDARSGSQVYTSTQSVPPGMTAGQITPSAVAAMEAGGGG